MAKRTGPDFTDVREAKKQTRFSGRKVPVTKSLLNPNIDDDEDENQRWYLSRALGSGSFGQVALWRREGEQNGDTVKSLLDFCAVKEIEYDNQTQYENLPKGVVKEGVYQHLLNQLADGDNVLFLRRYKAYSKKRGSVSVPETIRMYFDLAPYGNLEELISKYRAFDTHVPEAFVWYTFYSLAKAVQTMNHGRWTRLTWSKGKSMASVRLRDEVFLNHFDMKPDNVFLGPLRTEQAPTDGISTAEWLPETQYPQILVADFGMADLLTADNVHQDHPDEASYQDTLLFPNQPAKPNPHDYWGSGTVDPDDPDGSTTWGHGTKGFKPPEQLRWGAHWWDPPNGQRVTTIVDPRYVDEYGQPTYDEAQRAVFHDINAKDYRFTRDSNIWAVGRVIHGLAYLTWFNDYLEAFQRLPQKARDQEKLYEEFGGNMLPRPVTNPDYDPELHELISRCMDIDQAKRPDADELVAITKTHVDDWTRRARDMSLEEREQLRLYFRASEINNMKRGPNNFERKQFAFDELMKNKYADPEAEPLNLPDSSWGAEKRAYEKELQQGLGFMPQYEVGTDGAVYWAPSDGGISLPPAPQPIMLSLDDASVQEYRAFIEKQTRDDLLKVNITTKAVIDLAILTRIEERHQNEGLSIDDRSITAPLLRHYKNLHALNWPAQIPFVPNRVPILDPLSPLPARAELTWVTTDWSEEDGDSLLYLHDPTAPAALRQLSRTLETRIRYAIPDSEDDELKTSRRSIIEKVIQYIDRIQTARSANTQNTTDPSTSPDEEAAKLTEFLRNLRRRYARIAPPRTPPVPLGDVRARLNALPMDDLRCEPLPSPGPPPVAPPAPLVPPPPPAVVRAGDVRPGAAGPDGSPRYYCRHPCRLGDGICGHVCCNNGTKASRR